MKALFYEVQAGKPIYTRTLACKETGVVVNISIPMEKAEKEKIVERVSQAIATVDYYTIQVKEEKKK